MKFYQTTTEFNCGIDLHSRQMYMCVMDRQGHKLVHSNVKGNDFDYFLDRVKPYRDELTVCCECTLNPSSPSGLRRGRLALACRCLQRCGNRLRPGARVVSESDPRRQEQERPHRLGETGPPAAVQPDPAGVRVPTRAAARSQSAAAPDQFRLETGGVAQPSEQSSPRGQRKAGRSVPAPARSREAAAANWATPICAGPSVRPP